MEDLVSRDNEFYALLSGARYISSDDDKAVLDEIENSNGPKDSKKCDQVRFFIKKKINSDPNLLSSVELFFRIWGLTHHQIPPNWRI